MSQSDSQSDQKKLLDDDKNQNPFYIDIPWSPQTYFTVRGAENFHIILWIAKDISWTQDNRDAAMFFGVSALCWCVVLAYHACMKRAYIEIYFLIPLVMWLSANFLWMYGEVYNRPIHPPIRTPIPPPPYNTPIHRSIMETMITCHLTLQSSWG